MKTPDLDEIRRLEARIDARLQAVSSRFVGVDSRIGLFEQRLSRVEAAGTLDTRTIAEITAAVAEVLLHRIADSPTEHAGDAPSQSNVHVLNQESTA